MTLELWVLFWSTALLLLLILISAAGNMRAMGPDWGVGNREEQASSAGWAGRAKRAYMNLLENLVIFGAFVLVAHLAGIHNSLTLWGAELFLVGRIVHAVTYLFGITFLALRTLGYFAGVIGCVLLFLAILGL